jgi:hypothetical protein
MYRLLLVAFKINLYDGSWNSGQQSDGNLSEKLHVLLEKNPPFTLPCHLPPPPPPPALPLPG